MKTIIDYIFICMFGFCIGATVSQSFTAQKIGNTLHLEKKHIKSNLNIYNTGENRSWFLHEMNINGEIRYFIVDKESVIEFTKKK